MDADGSWRAPICCGQLAAEARLTEEHLIA
jgi:hypothetical protein